MSEQPDITNPNGGGEHAVGKVEAKSPDAETTPASKAKFSSEQQEVVNDLIDRMFGKGFDKGKASVQQEFESRVAELRAENEKLAKQLASFKPPAEETAAPTKSSKKDDKAERAASMESSPDFQQLLAKFDEMQSVATSLKQERDALTRKLEEAQVRSRKTLIKEAFITASKDISFFDPMEVYTLIEGQIDVDDNDAVVVINPRTKQPRLNASMEPMTLAEYLAEFATQKPYMVRASNREGGTGAGGSRRVKDEARSTGPDFNAMSNEEFEAYRQKILAGHYTR